MPTQQERLAGGLMGLLIGDALGVPYEFHAPEQLPPVDQIEFTPPGSFLAAHGVPPGTWSDDGAQALCLLSSLLDCGHFDAEDFGRRLLHWYDEGYYAVDANVFDIGIQTGNALRNLRAGVAALQAGSTAEHAMGNGSLMRVLPLALWHRGSDAELVANAQAQSSVTHGHLRVQVCCALYCLWARQVLIGDGATVENCWRDAVSTLRALYTNESAARAELEYHIRPDDEPVGSGHGYVVDSLRSARMVQAAGDYEAVVKAAIALGHDTDTTACIAGGIAGLYSGIEGIPLRWRTALRGQPMVQPLLARLLAFWQ